MKVIYGMYPVLPNPRKKVVKWYYYIQNKILAPAIIINRIGDKISNSSIVRTRVYMRDGGKTDANSAKTYMHNTLCKRAVFTTRVL